MGHLSRNESSPCGRRFGGLWRQDNAHPSASAGWVLEDVSHDHNQRSTRTLATSLAISRYRNISRLLSSSRLIRRHNGGVTLPYNRHLFTVTDREAIQFESPDCRLSPSEVDR